MSYYAFIYTIFLLGKLILILQNTGREGFLPTLNTVQDKLCSCKDPGHSSWSPAVRIHIPWQKTDIILLPPPLHSRCDRIELWFTHTSAVAKGKVIKLLLALKKSPFPLPRKMHATGWQRTKFNLPWAIVSWFYPSLIYDLSDLCKKVTSNTRGKKKIKNHGNIYTQNKIHKIEINLYTGY